MYRIKYRILLSKKTIIKIKEVHLWMIKNNIKHYPTIKTFDGWIFSLYSMEDIITFKLVWNGMLWWLEKEKVK